MFFSAFPSAREDGHRAPLATLLPPPPQTERKQQAAKSCRFRYLTLGKNTCCLRLDGGGGEDCGARFSSSLNEGEAKKNRKKQPLSPTPLITRLKKLAG
jgi:hypothetical protein